MAVLTPAYLQQNLIDNKNTHQASRMTSGKADAPAQTTTPEIVMTHFGRSGSTVLAKQLSQHSKIGWLNEIFSLEWIRSRETYDFSLQQFRDLVATQGDSARKQSADLIVGHEIKLMNFLQNPSCNMIDYAASTSDKDQYLHVVLMRRNTLRRIFSVYKAMQTKVYHVDTQDQTHARKTYAVDMSNLFDPDTGQKADTLPELIEKAQLREQSVLQNYAKVGIEYLYLTYEDDIEQDPRQAYRKIIEYAGLPFEPAEILLNKTGSHLRDEVTNFAEVSEALAGSKYEWMLT